MKNNTNILIIIILGFLFNIVMPWASVTAQNITSKKELRSGNNPASYRDADGHELVFNIKEIGRAHV